MGDFSDLLESHGVTRREFLKYCSALGAALALPLSMTAKIAEAIESDTRPPVIWLEFQDCAGDSESLLRANRPTVGDLVLDHISLDYHETIMAAAGHQAEASQQATVEKYKGKYICIVEGSIPTEAGGVYCTIGGRTAVDILKQVGGNAALIIAVGNCAAYGGLPAAHPNPTGAKGVSEILPGKTIINLPGCPMNVDNLTATVVHYLTFGAAPACDRHLRPLFAYGKRIHDNCERRAHFDAGQYVENWGDYGHRQGWCLYKMGCKGPETFHNCPTLRWNEGLSWPVMAGHGCVGCSEPLFFDAMMPMYRRLPNVPGFGVEASAVKIGTAIVGASAAIFAAHGAVTTARNWKKIGKAKAEAREEISHLNSDSDSEES
ncbi:MAG: [Ni/Fe] hydrogenase small subunit [Desulfuromonas sp.]|nr:MAG: [Ni/Fe] hydrogenase small subunit [Desulfuromonas sp.]